MCNSGVSAIDYLYQGYILWKVLAKSLRLLAKLNFCLDQNFWVQLRPFAKSDFLLRLLSSQNLTSPNVIIYVQYHAVVKYKQAEMHWNKNNNKKYEICINTVAVHIQMWNNWIVCYSTHFCDIIMKRKFCFENGLNFTVFCGFIVMHNRMLLCTQKAMFAANVLQQKYII